jgi:hypothetical protein
MDRQGPTALSLNPLLHHCDDTLGIRQATVLETEREAEMLPSRDPKTITWLKCAGRA